MKLVKICGLSRREDIEAVNEARPDLAGFVLFFPKSPRNVDITKAAELIKHLDSGIKSVAVTVSPTAEQLSQIESAGFDFVQIHGSVSPEAADTTDIPIIKAFNVSDMHSCGEWAEDPRVKGFVFDSAAPGSGKGFDYSLLEGIRVPDGKFRLIAGGLTADNVGAALDVTGFEGADTSGGAEIQKGVKDREKILAFVRAVKGM
ncbi:MAG: phosphoribosylanthranilate isomerase [Oscillospiraceae bacterium]|nr:phosphoribosylanthranilate isomerase [Oscillospiraceae bacterium]